eukprot:GFUD01007802.1.p1 GENE.GFUD01007802.1~~GFUD01007802.1.p1  ORF type:complete len:223 (-),score=50.94 GFUD01007802.1:143-748(-)
MFVLSEIKTLIRLLPEGFDKSLEDQLNDEINRKLSNKVMINVGLCLSLHDISEVGESFLFPGDGASHTKVKFRMLVFRPEMEEVLTGKIKSCSKEGVHVSLEFFDDILIPAESLQHPSRFDETESVWVWEYPVEDEDSHDLFMDPGEMIRFRVVSEQFLDTGPTKPKVSDAEQQDEVKTPPYRLVGTINEPGLGLLSWWNS